MKQSFAFKQTIKFTAVIIISLNIAIIWPTKSSGQIPPFTTPPKKEPAEQVLPWDLTKAYACGKFWCSNIYIYSDYTKFDMQSILKQELILTSSKSLNQANAEAAQQVEERARLVQQSFKKILQDITNSKSNLAELPSQSDWHFWLPTTIKPWHPSTPSIEVGIQNEQTVIYVPSQPELGLAAQVIVTVTEVDAKANGKTAVELASSWQKAIRLSLSNALWGYEYDQQHPLWRWATIGAIIGVTLGFLWFPHKLHRFVWRWNNSLKKRLNESTQLMAMEPEAISSQPREDTVSDISNSSEPRDEKVLLQYDSTIQRVKKTNLFSLFLARIFGSEKKLIQNQQTKFFRPDLSVQQLLQEQQTRIKQRKNLAGLLLSYLLFLQILILASGLIGVVLMFRQTRFLSVYFLNQIIFFFLLWIALILIDKIGDFVIDYSLDDWATAAQSEYPDTPRFTLRANTYSLTLKRATTFIIIVLGIYLSVVSLGINPSVLAGAGIFAVAIAFLSRSLIEDMLNGVLILWTDRYAIGDVIDIGAGMSGLVEDINLFVTSLRNLDGELIAIPNSKITAVTNKTKYWSRVNFMIKISWNENINRALDVLFQVATSMQSEPTWADKFLEEAQILGVDEVSNEGILLHLLIKTQPMEQWNVGREYRRRVKYAFDAAGISLAGPHHQISVLDLPQSDSKQTLPGGGVSHDN